MFSPGLSLNGVTPPPPSRPFSNAVSWRYSFNTWLRIKYRTPAIIIAQGNVSTHAIKRLRIVFICTPEPFAAIVPATPEESTWVVETGST